MFIFNGNPIVVTAIRLVFTLHCC